MKKILTINPGSTSTKLAYFEDDTPILERNLGFPKPEITGQVHVLDEFQARMDSINAFLAQSGIRLENIDMFVSRGGAPCRVEYGAYEINKHVIKLLCFNDNPTYHASNLAPILAFDLAQRAGGKPAIFYDAVSADMASAMAHQSGIPGMKRMVGGHNLNTRMVGREAAEMLGKRYEDCKFVIAHLGGGISVSAHDHGIIQDSVMCDEGPMGPQRAGRVSFVAMINMCFVEKLTQKDMQRITDQGGLLSYFNVSSMIELEKRIELGDQDALFMYQVMAYQVSKSIGEMFTVLCSEADGIILTGGVANSKMFTDWITKRVGRLAPIIIIPGEREMLAMARGGLRVLNGEEQTKRISTLPAGFDNMEQFIAHFKSARPDLLARPVVQKMLQL